MKILSYFTTGLCIIFCLVINKLNAQTSIAENFPTSPLSSTVSAFGFEQTFTPTASGTLTSIDLSSATYSTQNTQFCSSPFVFIDRITVYGGPFFSQQLGNVLLTNPPSGNQCCGDFYTYNFTGSPIFLYKDSLYKFTVTHINSNCIDYSAYIRLYPDTYTGGSSLPFTNYDSFFRVKVNGATSLQNSGFTSSSSNLNTLDQSLSFNSVSGATNYRMQINGVTNPSYSVNNVRNNTVNYFKMSWVPTIAYGETYNVKIAAYKNGTWGTYGPTSTISTPSVIPTTQLSVCGQTLTSTKTLFSWNKVVGATKYKVEIINAAGTYSVINIRPNNLNTFALSYVTGTLPNVTYNIRVSAYVGGVYGAYGNTCQVTALSTNFVGNENTDENIYKLIGSSDLSEESNFTADIFPNPSNGNFNVNLSENASVIITNILGDIILNTNVEAGVTALNFENQPAGIYFTTITTENSKKTVKIIKQ